MRPFPFIFTALCAISPTVAVAQAAPTRLDISAEGSVSATPDMVSVSAGVVSDAATAARAMSDNATRVAAMLAALKANGIAARDIQTGSLSLNPQYRYAEGKAPEVTGYQAMSQLLVRFRDVRRAGAILDLLVARGANQIGGPTLGLESPDPLLDVARRKAMATARARAELYATAAGMRVRRIAAISEGGATPPMPVPLPMVRAAEMKSADTTIVPGEQMLSVTVTVSFELE